MLGELIALIVGLVGGALLRGVVEDWLGRREHLREQRGKLYGRVLSPYAHAFRDRDAALEEMKSSEYQKQRFAFVMIADDATVRKQNQMLNAFIKGGEKSGEERDAAFRKGFERFGELLVQLRKDMGNEDTQLSAVEMLEGIGVSDVRKYLTDNS